MCKLFPFLFFLIAGVFTLSAQTYKQLWNDINTAVNEGKPQTVVAVAQRLFQKAQEEQNTPYMMQGYLAAMPHRKQLSIDSLYVDIEKLEQWASAPTTSVADAAMLHSLLGSIYAHSVRGRHDTKPVIHLPEDMSQWTQQMYYQRAFDHFVASVSQLEKLCSYTTHTYSPIVYFGRWSNYYNHDLMHLIGRRAAFGIRDLKNVLVWSFTQTAWDSFSLDYEQFKNDTLLSASAYDCPTQVMRIFQRMQALINPEEQAGGWIAMELNRMNVIPFGVRDTDEHIRQLEKLIERFEDNELCGCAYYDIATIHRNKGRNGQALAALREGIEKYPSYGAVNLLRNMEKEILKPYFNLYNYDNRYYSGSTIRLRVRHNNLDRFTVWLRKVNCPLDTLQKYQNRAEELKRYSKFSSEQKFALVRDKDYQVRDTLVSMTLPQESGVYLMEAIGNQVGSNLTMLYVLPYKLVSRNMPDGMVEYAVRDAKSGQPVKNATIQTARYDQKKETIVPLMSKRTDVYGNATLQADRETRLIRVCTATDNTMPYISHSYFFGEVGERIKELVTNLFADRTHIRPGQTIYIKGISYWQHPNDSLEVGSGEVLEVILKDPKGQIVEKKTVKNNEFGSFSTEFVLPTECLNGRYRIETSRDDRRMSNSIYIQVEEYKLPTFEVTFDTVKTAYAIGDTVTLTGRAMTYSGVPVADAKVIYDVDMECYGFLRGWNEEWNDWNLTDGETTTDSDGRFSMKVFMDKGNQPEGLCWWRNNYRITATVTSAAGESHHAQTNLKLSSCPLEISIYRQNMDFQVIKGKPHPLTFKVTNLNGEPINTKVDYRIYLSNEQWKIGELVYEGHTTANQPLSLEFLDQRPSAYYRVEAATAMEGKRDSTQVSILFCLFAENETKVPIGAVNWYNWLESKVAVGEPARLQLGTREENVHVQMDVFSEKEHIESRHFILSDTVRTFTFDYLPEYGKCMFVSTMFVKNGQVHNNFSTLEKKRPDNKLQLKWETFRNKLTPGTSEEWMLTVNSPDGTPADAELLASMYDLSLEQLGNQRKWDFRIRQSYPEFQYRWHNFNVPTIRAAIEFKLTTLKVPDYYRYDDVAQRFYNFDLPFLRKGIKSEVDELRLAEVDLALQGRIAGLNTNSVQFTGSLNEKEISSATQKGDGYYDEKSPETLPKGMMLRENFTETAFFQPHLRTDAEGRVKISFTLPDNLTRWRFRALAHTKQLEYGMLEDFVTAQREFMVQPNLPRFVRMGDNTTITATISNLSAKAVKGTARMELIDPLTEKVILSRKAKFKTEAGKTCTVSFAFTIDNTDVPLPICRIVADGGKFSDGEQRYLPVLTNKMWITESQPLMVNGPGEVTEQLSHLFNHQSPTATNHRLTVELTGNPIWTAIQALPTVATPTTEDAFAWAAAWYAHSVASHIAQSNPQIKAVFDQWRVDGANKESLLGNLQKNQELKTLLLTETPWVADANDETTQKRQLALLFDKAHTDSRITLYLDKMKALQNSDGGWSWYKGMQSSRYVTTYILELMERLIYLTGNGQNADFHQMKALAIEYLNKELLKEYRQMQDWEKEEKEVSPSELAIHYLSSLALNGIQLEKSLQKAADYMAGQLIKQMNALTPYGKAKASIILKQYRKYAENELFVASLKEYTTYTPQMGRFFDNPQPYASWRDNRLPTQVAAIEALKFDGGSDLYIEQMKQWLLIQKQAQCWDSPLNTVDAIHALLIQGVSFDKLPTTGHSSIKIDGNPVTSALIPGMDYHKQVYTTEELEKLPNEATLEKQTDGLAWGAVYAQYLEDMDKTTSTYTGRTSTAYGKILDQPLSIERTWLVQRRMNDGKQQEAKSHAENRSPSLEWIPLTEGMELHVGDKVISQLTIRADRAMDFVQVKECRAACTEPVSTASGYRFNGGLGYYCSVKDATTLYFIDHLPKGTYTLEQTFYIDRKGHYQAGLATVQCAYAPEFVGHTTGSTLYVE